MDHMKDSKEPGEFDINMINVMKHLLSNEAVDDDIMETMRMMNIQYHSLLQKNQILESQINIDSKTNLLKYRDDYLVNIIKVASRILDSIPNENYTISYLRFDIDDFSKINNQFGHDRGDEVLADIAGILKNYSRPTDYVIRYGGEEFDVILPSTDYNGAVTYCNKIYSALENLFYNFDGKDVKITLSAGLAIYSIPLSLLKCITEDRLKEDYRKIQKAADNALYDAKLSGKNRYKLFDENIDYETIRRDYTGNAQYQKTG